MGLEVVVNEIVEEGRKEAAHIEKEGLLEAKAILEEARQKAEQILNERRIQAEREAERIRIQESARAEFEAKKQVLMAKRATWDRLRAEVLAGLEHLAEADRRRILTALVAEARREIPRGTLHVRAQDKALVNAPGFQIVGDLRGVGGLIADDEGGNVSLDLTFESRLTDLWPQVLREESKRIFG
jgi:V/A-type H+/Na+-transporting ATPase subunit E